MYAHEQRSTRFVVQLLGGLFIIDVEQRLGCFDGAWNGCDGCFSRANMATPQTLQLSRWSASSESDDATRLIAARHLVVSNPASAIALLLLVVALATRFLPSLVIDGIDSCVSVAFGEKHEHRGIGM